MWKTILLNEFHDILPGSSIHEVYEVTKAEYAALEEKIAHMEKERLALLAPAAENRAVVQRQGL